MLAPQNQQPTVVDSMKGSVSQWYQDVDDCIKASEVIPGQYKYSTATSYGNVGDIQEGASTNFDITSNRFEIVSLDNSYISLDQILDITVPKMSDVVPTKWYIGYKMSAMAISQYRIYSNTDLVQTINHANYEWLSIYNSIGDAAKYGSDCFATLDKIREENPLVPGVYCDFSKYDAPTVAKVTLKLRIPIAHFLTLFNLRWFPNWAGKLQLEIIPSYRNIVIAPVIHPHEISNSLIAKVNASPDANLGFYNINQTMSNKITGTLAAVTAIATHRFECVTQTTNKCQIRLASYMLEMDVANALASKYIQVPLLFPIQTVESKDYTMSLGTKDNPDTAMTCAFRHCDSAYTVFRTDMNSTTCFINPCMSYQFNIDGKFYPPELYDTFNDIRSINQTFDALNINNSLLTSVPKDLETSLQPFTFTKTYAKGVGDSTDVLSMTLGDRSNFMIGIPFCDSEDFMGGISTKGTVQIQLAGIRHKPYQTIKDAVFGAPVTIFFQDAFLKIRSMKPDGRPQIEITNSDINQIIASGGR